jgi:hypothetical protein
MVLFEAEVNDGKITIKESELIVERDRIINRMIEAKENNDFDRWTYLAGQEKTIKDIINHIRFPEGRDSSDSVEFGV